MEIPLPGSDLNKFASHHLGIFEMDDLHFIAKKLKRLKENRISILEIALIKIVIEIHRDMNAWGIKLIDKPLEDFRAIHHVAPSAFDRDVLPHLFGITSEFGEDRFARLIAFFGLILRVIGPRRIIERTGFGADIRMAKLMGDSEIGFEIGDPPLARLGDLNGLD